VILDIDSFFGSKIPDAGSLDVPSESSEGANNPVKTNEHASE
jgi:hypothetical protein